MCMHLISTLLMLSITIYYVLIQEPVSKKVKTGNMEQSADNEWPEAWLMPDGDCEDQKKLNKLEPNVPITVQELKDLGIW